ncbi:Pentapeptide repeat [Trinorchestia longiramus]|nr:Pentapeptide repeat [Trinorchestia longiramus]
MRLETNNNDRFKPSDRLLQCSHCNSWESSKFNRSKFKGSKFNRSKFKGSKFNRSKFKGSKFNRSKFKGSKFNRSKFKGSKFNCSKFKCSKFNSGNFNRGNFNRGLHSRCSIQQFHSNSTVANSTERGVYQPGILYSTSRASLSRWQFNQSKQGTITAA